MNDLYFRCESCKRYVDAGYRWAYWQLVHTGLVRADDFPEGGTNLPDVQVEAVLQSGAYWIGDEDGSAPGERLAPVRVFLEAHRQHRISFGDCHRFFADEGSWFDWICDDPGGSRLLPRYFAEVLRLSNWGEVEAYVARASERPWWWSRHSSRIDARRRFEEFAQRVSHK